MTSPIQADVLQTSPSDQIRKGEETMRSTRFKSLLAAPVLALVLALSSSATADDGPPPFVGGGEASVQGHGENFGQAEAEAVSNLITWVSQRPGTGIVSYAKEFDWIMINGMETARCTITFQYYLGSPFPN